MTADIQSLFQRVLSPGGRTLGTELIEYDADTRTVTLGFLAKQEFTNILGAVHGGYVAAMLDETAGMAAKLILPEDKAVPTLDFTTSFYAPVPVGKLICEGRVLRMGRRTAFLEATLMTPARKPLAHMTVTALVTDIE